MKRLLACLALCASLSASAQDDNCTVLGIQDLTQMVFELQTQLNAQDATIDSLQSAAMTRDSVRAIARGEAVVGGSVGFADLTDVNLFYVVPDGFDLSERDLSGANFSDADLSGANLSGANLSGANLSGATLCGGTLNQADLSGANLSGANLCNVNLYGANLSGANLSGATHSGTSFQLTCLQGCPSTPPSGYICILDTDCPFPSRYRIVPQ